MNLTENLEKYCQEYYPLHMPGHKRRIDPTGGFLPVDIDTTEVTGVDDLHNATGILKEAQDRTAAPSCCWPNPSPACRACSRAARRARRLCGSSMPRASARCP